MNEEQLISEDLCHAPHLRLALVTETYPPEINGVAMTLGRMVEGLLARGHQLQLIRPRQHRGDAADASGELEQQLVRGIGIPRYAGLKFGLPARNALIRMWSLQRPDLVHVATEGPLGWSAISAARRLRLPVTSDFHTNFDHYSSHYGLGWLRQPVSAYLKRFHNRCLATYVPSQDLARQLRNAGYHGIEVIARGVDCGLYAPQRRDPALRSDWGVGEDGLAVLNVGRIAPEKNLELALQAFDAIRQRQPAARLILVGDGPARAGLQARRPDVIFAGMRRGEALAAHYASADMFLFPSETETFGNVTLEAMASGLPVVAFDYAAAAELFGAGASGLPVPPGDAKAFVTLAAELAADGPQRARLAQAARARAEAMDWEHIHDAFAASLARAARLPATSPSARLAEELR